MNNAEASVNHDPKPDRTNPTQCQKAPNIDPGKVSRELTQAPRFWTELYDVSCSYAGWMEVR